MPECPMPSRIGGVNSTVTYERTENPFALAAQRRRELAAAGEWEFIQVDRDGAGRATVTINRPEVYNCFNYGTLLELADAFHDLGRDPSVFVVVLTGSGDKAFCTGADLKEQREV